jgi:hypothetical protein
VSKSSSARDQQLLQTKGHSQADAEPVPVQPKLGDGGKKRIISYAAFEVERAVN